MPFYVKKKKIDNFMCLLEFECAKRLKAHSWAIPDGWMEALAEVNKPPADKVQGVYKLGHQVTPWIGNYI